MRYNGSTNGHNKLYAVISNRESHPDLIDLNHRETFLSLTEARKECGYGKMIVCYKFYPDSGDLEYFRITY